MSRNHRTPALPPCSPIALAVALLGLTAMASPAHAQASAAAPSTAVPASAAATGASRLSFSLPAPAGPHNGKLPLFFEADTLEGEADRRTRATGSVRLRQGELTVRADELVHTQPDNTARAAGHVRITRNGNVFSGPELTLQLDTLEGEFIQPQYWFARTQAGGQATLIEFLGENRLRAHHTSYSSCTPENTADGTPGEPDWSLRTSRVDMDFDANEGRAENAVIRFKGVPILAAPVLTFPLTEARKSGWLPPSIDYDTRNGLGIAEPYYWNIAPNMDATLTPTFSSRRGMGLGGEFRYLSQYERASLNAFGLPGDRVTDRDRGMVNLRMLGSRASADGLALTSYDLRWRRVSDDDYWKDFSRYLPTITPRLYDSHAAVERQLNARDWGLGNSQTALFASTQRWQVLRDTSLTADPLLSAIESPYNRNRAGVRSRSVAESGLTWRVKGQVDQFSHPDETRQSGTRSNLTGAVEQTFSLGGLRLTPRLSLDNTRYQLDQTLSSGSRSVSRTLPTFSVEAGFTMERPVTMFNRALTQTLEPRIQYVRTPYKDQSMLPLFDTAPRDFNQYAIYSENAYTGVDRISDANQVTVGLTSRLFDQATGAEALRLGVIQKVLLADQKINPTGDGPITDRLSDLLLLASTSVIPNWYLDNVLQLNAQSHEAERATIGMRYSPGGYRTLSAIYRYARERTNQVDVGWQWPIAGRKPSVNQMRAQASSPDQISLNGQPAVSSSACGDGGTWYSVGRFNYNMRDGRMANSLLGVEYDAGCWITRVVAERTTVGTTSSRRIMFQLELVGLSRIGSNPLSTLRDNIPGYRLLRQDDSVLSAPASQPFPSDD
ncbi:LPS-assembly protein LptD [uncultured Aquabacterium sp.]|uniref:LPS-assembly protein LptD n=1 Tax=uncultured Aquabacterium sp. TaxID=158753 RepID=UPI00261857EB|nr:LPS-assembly protein LptD [uncultured Aquabacterium sp.]